MVKLENEKGIGNVVVINKIIQNPGNLPLITNKETDHETNCPSVH